MIMLASIVDFSGSLSGMTAAFIGVGGFLAHLRPALAGADDRHLREMTVRGGAIGVAGAFVVVVLSALID